MFEAFPKLPRLSRECIVTEKIDGTNAQVYIDFLGDMGLEDQEGFTARVGDALIYAGSRSRLITPGKTTDNYGFAGWVYDNAEELVKLGPGRHFGEWWGKGIQRNYGLDEKRFSLFHTHGIAHKPDCVSVAPVLYEGVFTSDDCDYAMVLLQREGSRAAPGFMNPEGIVVYHTAAKQAFKKTFDDKHKEAA